MNQDPNAISQLMERFRKIANGKRHTAESLRDILNDTYLAHDPVCSSTVQKWMHDTIPRGTRLLAIIDFVKANGGFLHKKPISQLKQK